MKKLLLFFVFSFFILTVKGQAHLGSSESYIKNLYPEKKFTVGYSNSGKRYILADMIYGTYIYCFNKETKLSDFCIQVPFSLATMNGQVEAYNKKYVITSGTSWTAYLEGGGIMYIKLVYDAEYKQSLFTYSDTK